MSKKTFNVCVVGCGHISSNHCQAIIKNKYTFLYGLCDIDLHRLKKTAAAYSVVNTYTDYASVLADSKIDIISICTPSGLHADMAVLAAKHGKHVILEKPMAMTTAQARKINNAFAKSTGRLMVVLQNRFNPTVLFFKKYKNKLGKLLYSSTQTYWYRPQKYYSDGWHGTNSMDGGVLMNQGTHYVDMLLYLTEKRVKKVSAFKATLAHKMEAEDCITANILFTDGTIANIQANTFSYPKNFEGSITLFYEKATVKIGGVAMNEIVYWKGSGESIIRNLKTESIANIYGNGHAAVYKNFIDHIRQGKPLATGYEEGIKSLELIEKIYNSAEVN